MADTNVFCSQCGTANLSSARFCQKCGATVALIGAGTAMTTATPPPPSAAIAVPGAMPPSGAMPVPGVMPMPVMIVQPYGGFWIRVVAVLIDQAVVGIVTVPIVLLVAGASIAALARLGDNPTPEQVFAIVIPIIAVVVPVAIGITWLYEALMTSGKLQATLGKLVVGLKVTDLAGNRIGFGRATGRHFAKIISGMIMNIGYIMVAFTERKQGLHDMMAGTLVMKR